MKRYIILLLILCLCMSSTALGENLVDSEISKLAYLVNYDFEDVALDGSINAKTQGVVTSEVVQEENSSRFLRLQGQSSADNMFDISLPKSVSGKYIISFDARLDSVSYRQMPMLVGTSKAGSLAGLGYMGALDNGNLSDGTKSIGSYTARAWNHYTLAVDTNADLFSYAIGDKIVSQNVKAMNPIATISTVRFLLRGTVGIDIDNVMVYEGQFANSSSPGAQEPAQTIAEDMPIRVKPHEIVRKIDIYKPKGDIVIDGKLDEPDWNGEQYPIAKDVAGSATGTRASFAVMWNEKGLYIGGWTVDSTPFSDSINAPWNDDAFEVFIDGNNAKGNAFDDDDRQYLYSYKNTSPYNDGKTARFKAEGVQFAQSDTDDGFCVEFFVPFAAFFNGQIETGQIMGFDMAYDDDIDGDGRDCQFVWIGTALNSQTPKNYGEIVLADGFRTDNVSEYFKAVHDKIYLQIDSPKAKIGAMTVLIDEDDEEIAPVLQNESTYVPLRFLAQSLGCSVEYEGQTNSVTIKKGDSVVTNVIGRSLLTVNGKEVALSSPTFVLNGRTMFPVRSVENAFNKQVIWSDGLIVIGSDSLPSEAVLEKILMEIGSDE